MKKLLLVMLVVSFIITLVPHLCLADYCKPWQFYGWGDDRCGETILCLGGHYSASYQVQYIYVRSCLDAYGNWYHDYKTEWSIDGCC